MPRRVLFAPIVLLSMLLTWTPGAASAQSVGLGATVLRSETPDLPGGGGVTFEAAWPVASVLDVRLTLGRAWGRDTGFGSLCSGLLVPGAPGCEQQPLVRRNTVSSGELFALVRTQPVAGVRAGVGAGIGRYSFDVSLHGEDTGGTARPFGTADDRTGALFIAVIDAHPSFAGPLGLSVSARTAMVEFDGCVADAWGLCGDADVARVSLVATYSFR